jgi:hypothetical protein
VAQLIIWREEMIGKLLLQCSQLGLRHMELALEWMENHPNNPLPNPHFTYEETLEIYRETIKQHKQKLKSQKA